MKRIKAHGVKSWNNGWQGRAAYNRAIERSFRQTERNDIDEQLAGMADPGGPPASIISRAEILVGLGALDELIDFCGPLPVSLEDEQTELFELLVNAV